MKSKDPQQRTLITSDPKKKAALRRKLEEVLGEDLDKVAGGVERARVDPDNGRGPAS